MNAFKALGLAIVMATFAPVANAATVYATSVDYYSPAGSVASDRKVTSNALGAPDSKFLSLGIGGTAILSFGTKFLGAATIWETTFGNLAHIATYKEEVKVYFGLNGVFTYAGTLLNSAAQGAGGVVSLAGIYDQIKLVDISPKGSGRDGFDINAISVESAPAPVPLPASGLLLMGAIAGISALRGRKARA